MLLAYASIMAIGQLIFAAASKDIPFRSGLSEALAAAATSRWLWAGMILYGIATAIWLFILSIVPLRYAYPLAATSIALAPLFYGIVTGDFPAARYWAGLLLIIAGMALVTSVSS